MFIYQLYGARISSAQALEFDSRLDALPEGFSAIIRLTRDFMGKLMGLTAEETLKDETNDDIDIAQPRLMKQILSGGELIVGPDNLYIISIRESRVTRTSSSSSSDEKGEPEQQYLLEVHAIGPYVESGERRQLIDFLNQELGVELSPYRHTSPQFADLQSEGRTPPAMPSDEEISAAEALSDRVTRTLAIAIKQSSGLLGSDLEKQIPPSERARTSAIRTRLETAKLISTEMVVICTKSGTQIAKIPNASVLNRFAEDELRCACGKPIKDEKIDEALSISERGQQLIDSSHWLTILLIRDLVALGVPLDRLLIDQVRGDEMDCIIDVNGDLVLFELKDKDFNLGHAYKFGAKIATMTPGYSVVLTTERVGNDARDHFARARRGSRRKRVAAQLRDDDQQVTYIEGIDNLRPGLMALLSRIGVRQARRALDDVLPLVVIPSHTIVKSWNRLFESKNPFGRGN